MDPDGVDGRVLHSTHPYDRVPDSHQSGVIVVFFSFFLSSPSEWKGKWMIARVFLTDVPYTMSDSQVPFDAVEGIFHFFSMYFKTKESFFFNLLYIYFFVLINLRQNDYKTWTRMEINNSRYVLRIAWTKIMFTSNLRCFT